MRQKHQQTRFPLIGAHTMLDCEACHAQQSPHRYAGTPMECISCHQADFKGAANPNHVTAGFSVDCSKCHNTNSLTWSSGFNHNQTGFPLTGAHQSVVCAQCHKNNVFTALSTDCYSCHSGDFARTLSPNHVSGGFDHNCQSCHSTSVWQPSTFNHSSTAFPLTGFHTGMQCQACHTNGNYSIHYTSCYQCHNTDFAGATNPNHATGNFSHDCTTCHNTTAWSPATFDHNSTHFQLTGAHASVACLSCHTNGNYQIVYTDCYQCHSANFTGVASPNHVTGIFSHDCTPCHSTTAWSPSTFDHNSTHFQLTGAHATVTCQSCHTNGNYQLQYTDCYQCHSTNFTGTTNPGHVAGNFSHDCTTCHNTTAWSPATFDHNTTHFQLTGAHTAVACQTCHTNGNYQLVYTNCYQCHSANFTGATNPNHVAGNFSQDCTTCHNTTAWSPSTFDHNTTRFQLTGAHTTITCQSCHVSGNYQLTYTDCYQCHSAQYQSTTDPNHVAGNFSHNCATCHNTTRWSDNLFNHTTTGFTLSGTHVTTTCEKCHVNSNYTLTSTACNDCHNTVFKTATNPNHVSVNFSVDCSSCHNSNAWSPATFDHSATHFQITGAHAAVACLSCHVNSNYQLVYTNCYQCHSTNFTGALNPNHVAGNFSQDCTTCHNTTAWSPASFDHNTTHFPLTGKHSTLTCQTCHVNGNYQLTFTDCYQCHSADFTGAATPNHVQGVFSHDCSTCHSTTVWSPSTFDHSTTHFALTGAHAAVACQTCHVGGNYQLTYTNCYQCHNTDFAAATNPNHVSGNFSHDCTTCHTNIAWSPATFDHSTTHFQITGAHAAVACLSCHVNSNYQLVYTNCYQCHSSNFTGATNPNHVAGNFSQDCTTCHNTTAWSPATFDHTTTKFPLTGAHASGTCVSCHVNGNYQLTYSSCYQCHSADFAGTTNPNHTLANYPHDCTTCHTTTAWSPSTFNHDSQYFKIYSGKHSGRWTLCADCHTVATDFTQFTCINCHEHNSQSNVTGEHQNVSGFTYTPTSCYSCHRNV
jgi:Zn finger protein HypA/HybF involved in hydrogenase expression